MTASFLSKHGLVRVLKIESLLHRGNDCPLLLGECLSFYTQVDGSLSALRAYLCVHNRVMLRGETQFSNTLLDIEIRYKQDNSLFDASPVSLEQFADDRRGSGNGAGHNVRPATEEFYRLVHCSV